MNRIGFDQLVELLESNYRGDSRRLARHAMIWAVLGYFILGIAFLSSASLLVACGFWIIQHPGIVSLKFGGVMGIASGLLAFSIIRSLWNRLAAPSGRRLTRGEAPALFELIDSISTAAGGVHFHRVILTPELNAAVVQYPVAGIFGFHRNYLILGLPLLEALEPEEFKSVLAHEFSHLSHRDGNVGNWIYRIRITWERVAIGISQQQGLLTAPLRKFFDWFWPRFNARAFVLSRFNEYRADAFAASCTSPAISSVALQRIHLAARHLEDVFWEGVNQRVTLEPEPPSGIYDEMRDFIRVDPPPETASRWLKQALSVSTGTSDTHPSLGDRIKAFGGAHTASLPPLREPASEVLLGPGLAQQTRDDFSSQWRKELLPRWKETFQSRLKNRTELDELDAAPTGDSEEDHQWRRLALRGETEGFPAILPELGHFVARYPEHLAGSFILGSNLLDEDRSEGLTLLERVAGKDPTLTLDCLGAMANYYDRQGNSEAIRALKERADLHDDRMNQAMGARNVVSKNDRLLPHGLEETAIEAIWKILTREQDVCAGWLARKHHELFADWHHYVLALDIQFKWYQFAGAKDTQRILQRVADDIEISGYLLVIRDEGPNKPVCEKIRAIPGSTVYQMEQS